jgi:hypothetical protein
MMTSSIPALYVMLLHAVTDDGGPVNADDVRTIYRQCASGKTDRLE